MIKVTYQAQYQVKQGRRWVSKISTWTEEVKTESDAKLRAMALSWTIISMEKVG